MNRYDRIALIFSIIIFFVVLWITNNVFEQVPHLEDEMAYAWQAKTAARGDLYVPSPPCERCFLVPFVVDYNGIRFGKYPPGWPAVLSIGERLDIRWLVNPFFAGFSAWLLYQLVKKLSDEKTGLISLLLLGTSPFFLINAGSLLSHIWSLWLALVFIHAWLDTFFLGQPLIPLWMKIMTAGFALGLLALTRPLTAVGIALPFIVHGFWILIRGQREEKKSAIFIALISGFLAGMVLIWQLILTGNIHTNPYQLWWPYDRLGFGQGIGLQPGGYSWFYAKENARFSLSVGYADLFGWFRFSWIFIPFGLYAMRKDVKAWMVSTTIVGIVAAYTFYWIGSWLFGPRYYFEAIIAAICLSAAGIRFALGKLTKISSNSQTGWISRLRFFSVSLVVAFLLSSNIFYYLPVRLGMMHNLFEISSSQLTPFQLESSQSLSPALIIVHPQNNWREYGGLLELSSPYYDSPFIFTYSRGQEKDREVSDFLPNRTVWHYYPTLPYQLFSAPLPEVQRTD